VNWQKDFLMQGLVDRFRRWFEYERDAHAKVLASLATVPAECRGLPAWQKALDLLAHMVAARRLWLFRLGVAADGPRELFPNGVRLEEVTAELARVEAAWSAYLAGLTDADLARVLEYQSLDSGRFRNTVEDILTQLFGHSWYHRGQIAVLVRTCGGEPAVTDYIFWRRERVP
jgi:uncharacterized damage-inducible protein DinB